jgi:hypothetical protein
MSCELDLISQFKTNIISFLDELIVQFPRESDLVIFRIFLKDRIPIIDILNYFILKILPLKDMITNRNEDFFLNHCTLFDKLQSDKANSISHFKKLWRSGCLDDDDKKVVWQWFDSFVYLCEKYQKIKTSIK